MSESIYINIPERGSPRWKDPVANVATLPATGNIIGDVRETLNTTSLYTWNGTTWIAIAGPGIDAAFGIIQTDHGTYPTASIPTDVLTLTSSDNSITITGNSSTDTVNLQVASTSLSFNDSIVNISGSVHLVNDSVSPTSNSYYGTNGSSTLGYFNLPAATSPSGPNLSVQFDNGGAFGGNSALQVSSDFQRLLTGNATDDGTSTLQVCGNVNIGCCNSVTGTYVTAIGCCNIVTGCMAYAEGFGNVSGSCCGADHAEGQGTTANGGASHSEGYDTYAVGYASHSEGVNTFAHGNASHSEGSETYAQGYASHTEGADTQAGGDYSHAEGLGTSAQGNASHSEGYDTYAVGDASHSEGYDTYAVGYASHSEGYQTYACGTAAHAEGYDTYAVGYASHAEGYQSCARLQGQHAGASTYINTQGDAQYSRYYQSITTTNATPTTLVNGVALLTIPNKTTWQFFIQVTAYDSTDSAGAGFTLTGAVKNTTNSVSIIGTTTLASWTDAALSTSTVTLAADNTNYALSINVTGVASTNIVWHATIHTSEVTHG
jgi:hypothetical protein